MTTDPRHPGVLTVSDGALRATFDAAGFTVDHLRISAESVARTVGRRHAAPTWQAAVNEAQRELGSG